MNQFSHLHHANSGRGTPHTLTYSVASTF
uniref:Uncharacterized protein n=1 Tax=Arundo donax TaxID=35708 RepID=A0A0A9D432_ARUDO